MDELKRPWDDETDDECTLSLHEKSISWACPICGTLRWLNAEGARLNCDCDLARAVTGGCKNREEAIREWNEYLASGEWKRWKSQ